MKIAGASMPRWAEIPRFASDPDVETPGNLRWSLQDRGFNLRGNSTTYLLNTGRQVVRA
jgi:hypothetical protein